MTPALMIGLFILAALAVLVFVEDGEDWLE